MPNIFKEACQELSEELSLSPAQLIDSVNKWSEINVKLQNRIEEMKAEYVDGMKEDPTNVIAGVDFSEQVEFVDQLDGEFLRSAEQAGKDRY